MKTAFLLFAFCFFSQLAAAQVFATEPRQVFNADSVRAVMESMPYFTLFKDNYIIGGTTLRDKPSATNSDVKFQLSVFQRITKSKLPFDTYLFVQYTQKAFWNVFEKSLPMRDLNYNPGIGIGHIIIRHNKYIGRSYIMFEHESNGKDSTDSRSWNKVSWSTSILLNRNFEVQGKFWYPIVDGRNNKDLLKYTGLLQLGGSFHTDNERFHFGALFVKRKSRMSFNTQLEISYKTSRNQNQFVFLQYYNGYGESLLEYKQFQSKLRLGFVIKPPRGFSTY